MIKIILIIIIVSFVTILFAEVDKDLLSKAKNGNKEAQYEIGKYYHKKQSYQEAYQWYLLAAEQGEVRAQNNLGVLFDDGDFVLQNKQEAVKWYKLAADQGYATAQNNLGVMYAIGEGVEQDDAEAIKWYKLAADQDYAESQYNLGTIYENGDGVAKDIFEAINWYKQATINGHTDAPYQLGLLFFNGDEIKKNISESYYWIMIACHYKDSDVFEAASELKKNIERDLSTQQIESIKIDVQKWIEAHAKK